MVKYFSDEEAAASFLQTSLFSLENSSSRQSDQLRALVTPGPSTWFVLQLLSKVGVILIVCCLGLCLFYVACFGVPKGCLEKSEKRNGMSTSMLVALALTMFLDYSCTDQYQPNMPQMAAAFGVSQVGMGSTIQVHLFSCSMGMLITGPLSDRVGRRPVILACQLMQAISTFTCTLASGLGWFMAGRVLQGLAASVYAVIFASLRDCYDDSSKRLAVMGQMMSLMLIGPIFAPAFGGFVASYLGWRCPFALLAAASALLAAASWAVVTETATPSPDSHYLSLARRTLCNSRRLWILACVGITKALFDVVIASNAFILEERFGQAVGEASVQTAMFAVACAMGSVASGRLGLPPRQVLQLFTPLLLLAAAVLILTGVCFPHSLFMYLSSIAFLQFMVFPPIVAYHSEFTEELQDIAGLASSLDTAGMYFLSSVLSLPGVVAAAASTKAMLFVMAGMVVLTELITWLGIIFPTINNRRGEESLLKSKNPAAQDNAHS